MEDLVQQNYKAAENTLIASIHGKIEKVKSKSRAMMEDHLQHCFAAINDPKLHAIVVGTDTFSPGRDAWFERVIQPETALLNTTSDFVSAFNLAIKDYAFGA